MRTQPVFCTVTPDKTVIIFIVTPVMSILSYKGQCRHTNSIHTTVHQNMLTIFKHGIIFTTQFNCTSIQDFNLTRCVFGIFLCVMYKGRPIDMQQGEGHQLGYISPDLT